MIKRKSGLMTDLILDHIAPAFRAGLDVGDFLDGDIIRLIESFNEIAAVLLKPTPVCLALYPMPVTIWAFKGRKIRL